ncbi:MAG: 30S ribosomal protein S3 [archaeon]|jgi:small subunit ribosomal protein S3|nr:30S ribosomal protein S3 [archaeon]
MIERVFVKQGIRKLELENYLKKELDRAGFTGLEIVKTPLVTRIVLSVTRPGLAIGKEGQNIRQLTEEISSRFGVDNPQLEIQETPHASLNALAIVNKMAALLERGFSWRSIAFRTVNDIMGAGAQGAELVLSGKLAGKGGRKRKQRIAVGYMKKVGEQTKLVDYAKASAYPKAGAIGIKLRIIHPGVVFPDKINVQELLAHLVEPTAEEKAAAEKEKAAEAAETKEEKPAAKKKRTTKDAKEKAEKASKKKKEAGKEKAVAKEGKKVKVKTAKEVKAVKKEPKAEEKKEETKVEEKKE